MPDLPILGQFPEDKAFERYVQAKVAEPYRQDQGFMELLRTMFVAGWDAHEDHDDEQDEKATWQENTRVVDHADQGLYVR
jgi:hypothetical protein